MIFLFFRRASCECVAITSHPSTALFLGRLLMNPWNIVCGDSCLSDSCLSRIPVRPPVYFINRPSGYCPGMCLTFVVARLTTFSRVLHTQCNAGQFISTIQTQNQISAADSFISQTWMCRCAALVRCSLEISGIMLRAETERSRCAHGTGT